MTTHSNLSELINTLEMEIASLTEQVATLKKAPENFNEEIIFKYIETGSTGKTKDFVRSLGIKSERGSLFSSGDVTKLIKEGAEDISPDLLGIARTLINTKNNGKRR